MSIWIAVRGRACGPACHHIGWSFKGFRACGASRSTVSPIEWLRGDGTFIGFQGTLVLCIQSTRDRIATEYCLPALKFRRVDDIVCSRRSFSHSLS